MVEFRDRGDVERWLRGRPHADAVVLAARAALRVLPALAAGLESPARTRRRSWDYASVIVLPVFRAMATPWVAANYSTQGVASSASSAGSAASATPRPPPPPPTLPSRLTWKLWMRVSRLTVSPTGRSGLAASGWERLKADLLVRNEGWEVWTDWYEARRDGRRARRSIEIARVTLDEAFWKAGPKAVNAEIRRLIEEDRAKAKPAKDRKKPSPDGTERLVQRPSSHRFDWRGDRLEAVAVTERPFDPVLAEAIAEALREKAADLLAALTGNHADDVVSRDVRRALDLLGNPVDAIAEGLLLMRANTVAAHARAYADAGHDRERAVRAALDDVSTSLGNLIDCYPGVRRINANRLELEVQAADAPAIAAQLDAIADLARASPVVAPSAAEALDIGRDEAADLDAKIAGSSGEGRAGYIADRGAKVAARLLDATNFVSAVAKRVGSECVDVGGQLGVTSNRGCRTPSVMWSMWRSDFPCWLWPRISTSLGKRSPF